MGVVTAFGGRWAGRRVLVTGATGFKGAWLSWWLSRLGARVTAIALPPPTTPSLFEKLGLASAVEYREVDVCRAPAVAESVARAQPDAIFHLAAQSLVRTSYDDPLGTLATNVLGTAHVLDAVRAARRPCAVVIVTSDKCYENHEWDWGYRENDPMGGHDVYSASKGCAELVTASYRRAFFPAEKRAEHGVAIASARAGNVIGFGDWARDRIVPDCAAALAAGRPIDVRNPSSVRPWQHVLEPLSGYLWLGDRLLSAEAATAGEAWNFGPHPESERTVESLVNALIAAWGAGSWQRLDGGARHEARTLRLAIDKAVARLGWTPAWSFAETAHRTAIGYRDWTRLEGAELRARLDGEIDDYVRAARDAGARWPDGRADGDGDGSGA
ncbi:MAG TPA: CDP-glucose 4,6-dehydratase [Polyangia bacterium]|nr:CDP-glucose 4,6-dehydratase [Polyangia bacterium]